jgi:tetratricopeptide (TPR) repeat protein
VPDLKARLDAALGTRYVLLREVGRGGMATVWLAEDLRHARQVAIKVLHPELAASIGTGRFLREIEIAASLVHPHILPLHESGEAGGLLYYVMPYVEGESLRDRLRREVQLPLEDALRIAEEVADALGYAHGRGVVHRDIKPENILLEGGHAVVADFGVALALESAGVERLTATGLAVGTPAYMSPEQAGGSSRLDGRSDIYALGCVLFEMLAGEPPFSAPTPQALAAKHLQAVPPRVRLTRGTVPEGVERVIQRALAKVPADRFESASQFGQTLATASRAIHNRDAISASHIPIHRSSRALLVSLVLAVALLGVAIGRVAWLRRSEPRPLDPNRVVVFPLRDNGGFGAAATDGEAVATYIGYGLEGSEPLRWLDGWDRLTERQRAGLDPLTGAAAAHISRRESARYFIEGAIIRTDDSITVVLRLHDAEGDSLVKRVGSAERQGASDLPRLGLTAVRELLPALVQPGQVVDLLALSGRKPAAVAGFLLGESRSRRMQFAEALAHYQQALRTDSALILAAVKGAQAAKWLELDSEARRLNNVVLSSAPSLPARYKEYAVGLRYDLAGDADSAVAAFRRSLVLDGDWAEAWMALGEVYFHRLPDTQPLDSLAVAAFAQAERVDSSFTPALYHLAQNAIREQRLSRAASLIDRIRKSDTASPYLRRLEVMEQCVRKGATAVDWAALSGEPELLLQVSIALSASGRQIECARVGLKAAFAAERATASERWGALLGLQGILAVQGRVREITSLLESEIGLGMGSDVLYLVLGAAGAPVRDQATKVAWRHGKIRPALGTPNLWALGLWYARERNTTALATVLRSVQQLADSTGARQDLLVARALAPHLSLLRGDSVDALAALESLRPNAGGAGLKWQPWESLGAEKLLQARLLLAKGMFARAAAVAAQFDSPQPVIYLVYLPSSIAIRIKCAEALGLKEAAAALQTRLGALRAGAKDSLQDLANLN